MNEAPVTREQIDAITAPLRSMPEGRHREVFMVGVRLYQIGLALREIETELHEAVGREPHMQKKVPGVIRFLRKYGRLRGRLDESVQIIILRAIPTTGWLRNSASDSAIRSLDSF